MPFIWDDYRWDFVDDEDEYDKKRFVVARKLFITASKDQLNDDESEMNHPFDDAFIRRNLRKYGEIEEIEMLQNGKSEAYVTFTDSLNAYLVVLANDVLIKSCKNVFHIQPADSWVQPSNIDNKESEPMDDDEEPEIFRLNDDCFRKIFEYLDFSSLIDVSEVCRRFETLTEPIFHRTHQLNIVNNNSSTPTIPLARFRRYMKHIGQYIQEISYHWHDYDHDHRIQRFLDKFVQYCGKQLRKIHFRDVLSTEDQFTKLKPILENLETLEIITYNPDYELDVDFVELCPNLRKLKLLENMVLVKCCKPWPSLQYFSIVGNEYMVSGTFRLFLQQNPQLKCIKFTAFEADDRLLAVAQNVPNIERLTIFESFPEFSQGIVSTLCGLQHLTKLSLVHVDENHIAGIFVCLSKIASLREVKIQVYDDASSDGVQIDNALISLADALPNLEKFFAQYLPIKETTLGTFVHRAKHLKLFHMHSGNFKFVDSIIRNIARAVEMRSRNAQIKEKLNLFIDKNDFTDLSVIHDKEIMEYLRVDYLCRHNGY